MKKLLILLMSAFILFPTVVSAETQVKDLKETVESIDLTMKNSDYTENDNQVVVYLFRWTTCNHCHDAIEYLNELADEIGDKFKVRSFETSQNADNRALQSRVVKFMDIKDSKGDLAAGVPIIVIGKSHFYGFNDSFKSRVKESIESNYKLKNRYDVFEEMEKKSESNENTSTIIMVVFLTAVIGVAIYFIVKKK